MLDMPGTYYKYGSARCCVSKRCQGKLVCTQMCAVCVMAIATAAADTYYSGVLGPEYGSLCCRADRG